MSGGAKTICIRNPISGLFLDAKSFYVTVEGYSGQPSQLWHLEPIGDGKVVIINEGNGNALDVEGGSGGGVNVITYPKHGLANQQWFINSDETIVSALGNYCIEIYDSNLTAGNRIIINHKNGGDNQKFNVLFK